MDGLIQRMGTSLESLRLQMDGEALERIHGALESSIREVTKLVGDVIRNDEECRWRLDDACDHIEALLGPAFVAVQTYVTAVRMRVACIAEVFQKHGGKLSFATTPKAYEVLSMGAASVLDGYSDVQVLIAVANFWKHHEEWPTRFKQKGDAQALVWDADAMKDPNHKSNAVITIGLGIEAANTGQLRTACHAFGVDDTYDDLRALRDPATRWAKDLYNKALAEIKEAG